MPEPTKPKPEATIEAEKFKALLGTTMTLQNLFLAGFDGITVKAIGRILNEAKIGDEARSMTFNELDKEMNLIIEKHAAIALAERQDYRAKKAASQSQTETPTAPSKRPELG